MSKMNKTFKNITSQICSDMIQTSQFQHYEDNNPKSFKEVTWKEKVFKGQKIVLTLYGKKENLSDLQLCVYVNNDLKYATKKGVFKVKTFQVSRVVFKKWLPRVETNTRQTLIFKSENDFKKFDFFIRKLRDCVEVNDVFHELCSEYCKSMPNILGNYYTKTVGIN